MTKDFMKMFIFDTVAQRIKSVTLCVCFSTYLSREKVINCIIK
jgi:hypothetical protein